MQDCGIICLRDMEAAMDKETILSYLKSNKERLKKEYEIEQIGIFGSYARNEANENSDIDIFVKMKPDFFKVIGLKQQLEEYFNKKVDIVRLREKINNALKRRILKDGIYV